MIRRLLLSLGTCLPILHAMAQDGLWTPVSKNSIQPYFNGRSTASPLPDNFELVKLNRSQLKQLQLRTPLVKLGERSNVSPAGISFPLPVAGQSLASGLIESPILSNDLSKQLTGFKTYELKDPATNVLQGRISITSQGISGLIFTDKGSAYISPVSPDYPDVHMVYYVKDQPVTKPVQCGAKEVVEGKTGAGARVASVLASDCSLRNYRLAVAATGEYTQWAGSQAQALTYIGILVNDVTAIYERDAGITFTLVTNNSLIFTDPATDPYITVGFPDMGILDDNTARLDMVLGSANYDQGILLNRAWNGGLAYMSAVCNNSLKGGAAAGLTFGTGSNPTNGPQGPIFTGTVAHEMAHMFSADHTMASGNSSCGGGNVNPPTGYEPGGGSTIMAYAGSCGLPDAYQNNSDLYFHGYSILQIANYSVNSATCRTPTPMSNAAPAVSVAAAAYTIPVSTPFMLTATGTDANNATLYYCWEQLDAPSAATSGTPSAAAATGPLFRSYPPTTTNTRVFPRMSDLVSGAAHPFDVLPSISRALHFQVMVRDAASGGGCTAQTTVTVNTSAAGGAFTVTSQNATTTWTANGSNTATVTWNVAGTNAAPVNCSNVDIILSKDGGVTYTDTLVANTANDGTETFTVPNLPTSLGRVMVKARGNIFFNINSATITISSSCSANGATFTPGASVTAAAGNASLDLSLSPVYGAAVPISGQLAPADPSTGLVTRDVSGSSCVYYGGNVFRYDTYQFTPGVTGSYTFNRAGGTDPDITFVLVSGNFNASVPCTNFINSSTLSDGSTINSYSATLTAGIYYTMAVGTFDVGFPSLTANYTISVTPPAGGGLFNNTPNPGAGFNYTYVIVDNATGLIKAFDPSADLSNAASYPVGSTYTIYGLSYSNAVSLATLGTYVGSSYASFRDVLLFNPSALCGNASANNLQVMVTAVLTSAQLLPLTATKADNAVNLKWANTSSEKTSYFEIWRSADGTNFNELIGTVPVQNSFSSHIDYQLNDNAPLAAWNYYRVKQFDVAGNVTMSNIARVNMQENAASSALTVYPNPVRSTLTLAYHANSIETVGVRVLNSKGSLVYQHVFAAQTGANQYSIPAAALAKGVYIVQLVSNAGSYTSRFVKE